MKLLVAMVVLVVVAGAFWFFGMRYKPLDLGVSAANPLGDPAKIEKALTSKGLRKDDPPLVEVKSLLGDRMAVTDDLKSSSYVDLVPGLKHQVIVARKPDGKVVGIVSHFRSGGLEFSKTGTKCENFAALYWVQLAGGPPKFTKEHEGGADAREYLFAKFTKGPVEATWKKESGGATLMVAQEIADTVTFTAK